MYEKKEVTHTVRQRDQVIVIDHVPAEVCSVCGDVLFSSETVRHIGMLLKSTKEPARMVPLFEYA
ncbi:MAG: YgiT-type zinc finger protein [Chloroflexi bacterium]|nr:YgiT-type zinc finger protein [Chloroflexota bacterium]